MTPEYLYAKGRRLSRDCQLLRETGPGDPVAMWWRPNQAEIKRTGVRCWMSFRFDAVPGCPEGLRGIGTVFTDEQDLESGSVEVSTDWPQRPGVPLFGTITKPIAPWDMVMASGTPAIVDWRQTADYRQEIRPLEDAYDRVWQKEYPCYFNDDTVAVLGGHYMPGPWVDDPSHYMDMTLLVLTLRDSEPWIQVWVDRIGGFHVLQCIT